MGADKGKKAEDEIDELIDKLQKIQDKLEINNEDASDEDLKMRKLIYKERNDIIKTIPKFWMTVFTKHPIMDEYLCEEDHPIFEHLAYVEVEDSQDLKSGHSISLIFDPNPYFEDEKLTQTFELFDDRSTKKSTGTMIRWKEGQDVPHGAISWENKDTRTRSERSFFNFFGKNEALEDFQLEVAAAIMWEFWPNPVPYFNEARKVDDDDVDGDWHYFMVCMDLTMMLKRGMIKAPYNASVNYY